MKLTRGGSRQYISSRGTQGPIAKTPLFSQQSIPCGLVTLSWECREMSEAARTQCSTPRLHAQAPREMESGHWALSPSVPLALSTESLRPLTPAWVIEHGVWALSTESRHLPCCWNFMMLDLLYIFKPSYIKTKV